MTKETFIQFLRELFEQRSDEFFEVADVQTRTDGIDVMLVDGTTFEMDVRRNGYMPPQ